MSWKIDELQDQIKRLQYDLGSKWVGGVSIPPEPTAFEWLRTLQGDLDLIKEYFGIQIVSLPARRVVRKKESKSESHTD